MTVLGEFGGPGGNFEQGAARACNGASQAVYKHPRGSKPDTLAIALLPTFVGDLFQVNGVAHPHDLVGQTAVQALAMSGQLAFPGGLASPRALVAAARLPVQAPLAALAGATSRVVVLGIGRASLPIQLAL